MDKRKLLKGIGASSLWATPTVATILTPAHAQATASACTGTFVPETLTFDNPGEFSVVVPDCATRMSVEVAGGSSGRAVSFNTASTAPGTGSLVNAMIDVNSGETLTVIVGEQGGDATNRASEENAGGFGYGRGGNGGVQVRGSGLLQGASGGGGSAILLNNTPLAVAGGGGGVWRNEPGTNGDTNALSGGATAGSNGQGGVGGTSITTLVSITLGPVISPNGENGGPRDGGAGSPGAILGVLAHVPGGGGGGGFGGGGGGGGNNLQGQGGGGGGSMFTGNGSVVPGGASEGNGSVTITFE